MNEALYMRALVAAGVVLALFVILIGGFSGQAPFGAFTVLAGAAWATGLLISKRNPLLGIGLVAGGAITIAIVWYWALVVTIPIGIAMIAIAFFRARSTGWPRGPAAA